jgi:hypothetical protein
MTDDRRLEIERRFDGELDGEGDLSSVAFETLKIDSEARRHLDRLAMLRELARRHDPASEIPRSTFDLPGRRARRAPWWLAVAASAAAIAVLAWPSTRVEPPAKLVKTGTTVKSTVRSFEPTIDRPPLEVELYGWANTASRAPKQAARLVLAPASPSRKRSPADEILALELANTSLNSRSGVQRFAVSKSSKPASAPRPGHRAKATLPEV